MIIQLIELNFILVKLTMLRNKGEVIMKKNKKLILFFICVLVVFCLSGCAYTHYTGENTDLYTIAVNSLLWTNGHSFETDRYSNSEIEILEKDNYGRILFLYEEKYFSGGQIVFSSLLICQKKEDNYVFYYPDYNFISIERNPYLNEKIDFSIEQIEELKNLNDWNKEINLEKCVKKEISNTKQKVEINDEILNEIFSRYDGYENNCEVYYLTNDDYGRFICYGTAIVQEEYVYLVMIFNPDSTYNAETCFYEPADYYNYQEEFKQFKELNNWNGEL